MNYVKIKTQLPKSVKYVKVSEAKPGDTLVLGSYIGAKQVDNYNKDGKVNLHSFETDDGVTNLNGSTLLDRLLAEHTPGDVIEVVFTGKENKTNKEGKKYKQNQFEVSKLVNEEDLT